MVNCPKCTRLVELHFDNEYCTLCLADMINTFFACENTGGQDIFKEPQEYAWELLQRLHGKRLSEEDDGHFRPEDVERMRNDFKTSKTKWK